MPENNLELKKLACIHFRAANMLEFSQASIPQPDKTKFY